MNQKEEEKKQRASEIIDRLRFSLSKKTSKIVEESSSSQEEQTVTSPELQFKQLESAMVS